MKQYWMIDAELAQKRLEARAMYTQYMKEPSFCNRSKLAHHSAQIRRLEAERLAGHNWEHMIRASAREALQESEARHRNLIFP